MALWLDKMVCLLRSPPLHMQPTISPFYPPQELRPISLQAYIIRYVPYMLCNFLGDSPIALSTPLRQILYLTCHRTRIVMQKISWATKWGELEWVFLTGTSASSGARDLVVCVRLRPTPVT